MLQVGDIRGYCIYPVTTIVRFVKWKNNNFDREYNIFVERVFVQVDLVHEILAKWTFVKIDRYIAMIFRLVNGRTKVLVRSMEISLNRYSLKLGSSQVYTIFVVVR